MTPTDPEEGTTETTIALTGENTTFDDALNQLMGHTTRPKTDEDEEALKTLPATLIKLC